jgi:uncharacterized membrane protein
VTHALWFPVALFAAFFVASADALTKKVLSDYSAGELVVVRFLFTALVLSPLLLAFPLPTIPPTFWGWVAALVPLEILGMYLYMKAIRETALSLTLPYLAFTPVFITLTGYLLLGETVTLQGLGGILLVVVGAYLLNLGEVAGGSQVLAPLRAIARERGSRLMLAVAAIYSLTSVMGKGALQYVPETFFAPFYVGLVAMSALVVFSATRPRALHALWRRPGWHLALGGLMAAMLLAHFLAIQMVEAAYMIAVKRVSLLFGIAYGVLLFRESRPLQHFLAGGLMVLGVALIAAA